MKRCPALKVSGIHLRMFLDQPPNQLGRRSTRRTVGGTCVVERRPKATAGDVGSRASVEEQVGHLGSAEAARLC